MRRVMRAASAVGLAASLLLVGARSPALSVTIGPMASGGFGEPVSGAGALVPGQEFAAAGEAVEIVVTGTLFLAPGAFATGPDGIPLERQLFGVPGFTPLEEKLVDAGTPPPIGVGGDVAPSVGAAMGAFVPAGVASAPGFSALDDDFAPLGISSSQLFLIGAGPFLFVSPGPGTLFLGVNDMFVSNNSGAFTATLVPIPEPGTSALVGLGLLGLAARRRRGATRTGAPSGRERPAARRTARPDDSTSR